MVKYILVIFNIIYENRYFIYFFIILTIIVFVTLYLLKSLTFNNYHWKIYFKSKMRIIFIILLIFLSNLIFFNETNENEEEIKNTELETFKLFKEDDLDDLITQEPKDEDISENENSLKEDVIKETDINISEEIISNSNILDQYDLKELKSYFKYIKNIKSKTLQNHFISTLETVQFDLKNEKDKELLFLITNYLNSIGQLNKSYKIIENYQLDEEKIITFMQVSR